MNTRVMEACERERAFNGVLKMKRLCNTHTHTHHNTLHHTTSHPHPRFQVIIGEHHLSRRRVERII